MRDLLATIKEGRNWREVAALLAHIGGVHKSPAWWLQIARGDKKPHREDENAVRRCFPGWPDLPPTADELIDAFGVEMAIIADPEPDAALLVKTDGAYIAQIVMKASESEPQIVASRLVTAGNIHVAKRRQRSAVTINYMDDLAALPDSAFSTHRGKTGNLAAIADAARSAREALYNEAN
jgi:hypothetical protein